jgi:hypothetical protein
MRLSPNDFLGQKIAKRLKKLPCKKAAEKKTGVKSGQNR